MVSRADLLCTLVWQACEYGTQVRGFCLSLAHGSQTHSLSVCLRAEPVACQQRRDNGLGKNHGVCHNTLRLAGTRDGACFCRHQPLP